MSKLLLIYSILTSFSTFKLLLIYSILTSFSTFNMDYGILDLSQRIRCMNSASILMFYGIT
jgi:hypothetical protein